MNEKPPHNDPFKLFEQWLDDAKRHEPNDPTAMTLATCANNQPQARMVLMKFFDHKGFVFATNYKSAKGQEISQNNNVALLFHWKSLRRQVRITGSVSKCSTKESIKLFDERPEPSRIAALISQQSQVLKSRELMLQQFNNFKHEIKRIAHWGGYRVTAQTFEFWNEGSFRLHDRWRYQLNKEQENNWNINRLYP